MHPGDREWGLLSPGGLCSFVPWRLASLQWLEAGPAQRCLRAELSLQRHPVPPQAAGGQIQHGSSLHCRRPRLAVASPVGSQHSDALPVDQGTG